MAILPQNPQALRYLKDRLLLVPAIQFPFVRDQLYWHRSQLTESYWKTALDESLNGSIRFRALCALATFDGKHKNWQLPNLMHFTARYLVNVRPSELSVWRDALWPVFQSLTAPLSNIYRNSEQEKQERFFATTVLSHYLSQDAEALFDLMADANNKLFPILYEQINFHRADAISFAHAEISKTIELDATESEKERIARRRANSAVYLLRNIECDQVWPLLRHNPNPRARSYLIHWMAPLNVNPRILINRYRIETDPSVIGRIRLRIN